MTDKNSLPVATVINLRIFICRERTISNAEVPFPGTPISLALRLTIRLILSHTMRIFS